MFTPRDMLRYASVPGLEDVYVLGCLDRRVTIVSQQTRALNVVDALFSTGRLKSGDTLVVVGAGFAGLTAAAAAAFKEANVMVLEREPTALSLQTGCTQRWIHPHIYDWPKHGSESTNADLPIMNWRAGPCSEVTAKLLEEVSRVRDFHSLDIVFNVGRLDLLDHGYLRYSPNTSPKNLTYDEGLSLHCPPAPVRFNALIIAVGFGEEQGGGSYWREDDLEQPFLGGRRNFVVSGIGDGGLIDAIRLRIGAYDGNTQLFPWLVNDFLPKIPDELREQVAIDELANVPFLDIFEGEERTKQHKLFSIKTADAYRSLDSLRDLTRTTISKRLRPDTHVKLVGSLPEPFSPNASALNRFLVAMLREADGAHFEYVQGRTDNDGQSVHRQCLAHKGEIDPIEQDTRVILRHGPQPALAVSLKGVFECLRGGAQRLELDAARLRQWNDLSFEGYRCGE